MQPAQVIYVVHLTSEPIPLLTKLHTNMRKLMHTPSLTPSVVRPLIMYIVA